MSHRSLEESLQAAGDAVTLARNSQMGPYVYPKVPSEFTNWRDEQRSWQETCALFDQSHHMTDLYVEGPDVIRLLSALGVNSFENFRLNKAMSLPRSRGHQLVRRWRSSQRISSHVRPG